MQMLFFGLAYLFSVFLVTFPIINANPFSFNLNSSPDPSSNLLVPASEIDASSSFALVSPDSGDLGTSRSLDELDSFTENSSNGKVGSTSDRPSSGEYLGQRVIEDIWDCGAQYVSCCDGPYGIDQSQIIGCSHLYLGDVCHDDHVKCCSDIIGIIGIGCHKAKKKVPKGKIPVVLPPPPLEFKGAPVFLKPPEIIPP